MVVLMVVISIKTSSWDGGWKVEEREMKLKLKLESSRRHLIRSSTLYIAEDHNS